MLLNENERDALLWSHFRDGDQEAFVSIFKNYYSSLFTYGCKITPQKALIEDCIQELFIDLWRTNGKSEISFVKAYIFKAFKFRLIKIIEKNNKSSRITDAPGKSSFEISKEMLLISEQKDHDLTEKVLNALEKLPARQKEVIYLKFYLGFSYEEVSHIMNINYQATRNLVYKSIKGLKKTILVHLLFSMLSL